MRNPFRAVLAAAAVAVLLGGCAAEPDAQRPPMQTPADRIFGRAFWDGDVCVTRTSTGRITRVAPSNCPPRG